MSKKVETLSIDDVEWIVNFLSAGLTVQQRVKLNHKINRFRRVAKKDHLIQNLDIIQSAPNVSIDTLRDYKLRVLAGRCANGAERDHGAVIHAVPRNDYKSLCGKTYGTRSAGWVIPYGDNLSVTCEKCLKAIGQFKGLTDALSASATPKKDAPDQRPKGLLGDWW